jgi:hypothetical protein
MADKYSRAKYIDDLVSSGEFSYEEAKKFADEYERGAPTKVEKPESAAISEPSPADVQAGLQEMKTEREKQEGMTFGEKAAIGAGGVAAGGAATYLLTKKPGIKDRMIGDTARIEPKMDVNQQGPKEPTFAPEKPTPLTKAASLAEQFQAEYGIPLSEVEQHYQVPIKDMQEARLLGGAYKANIAPATPAGVIPSTTNMTTAAPIGVAPPAAMPEPTISAAPVAPAAPAPAAPVIEVPVIAATEADVPSTIAAKPSKVDVPEGMREQYAKGKKNPIGPGGYNWLYGQEGERAPATWENLFGKKNVPYEEARNKYLEFQLSGQEPGRGLNELPRGEFGGSNKKPKLIPDYIKGGATLGGLGMAAGGSLAALGVMEAIKKGKKTGDYTDLGQIALDTVAGAINPALLFGTYMSGAGEGEAEALAKERYKEKVGGGRGVAPPSPRSQVGRR